jgi:hypothetical protein
MCPWLKVPMQSFSHRHDISGRPGESLATQKLAVFGVSKGLRGLSARVVAGIAGCHIGRGWGLRGKPARGEPEIQWQSSLTRPITAALPRGKPPGRREILGIACPPVALTPQWRQDYPNNRPPSRATAISAMGHVWTAPGWQGISSRVQQWSEQPCVRPVSAVHVTAGHNALRGSGPGHNLAFDNALAQVGCPDRRIDRLCITCCSPFPTVTSRRMPDAISFTPRVRRVPCIARP